MMGDLDIKGALSSITSEALLEAAILVVIASLLIIVLTITMVVPVLVEPSFENMVAIFGALALGFAFKDYANSLIAGIVTLYEMPYRPGDWIEVNGQYGEVRSIGTRAAEVCLEQGVRMVSKRVTDPS